MAEVKSTAGPSTPVPDAEAPAQDHTGAKRLNVVFNRIIFTLMLGMVASVALMEWAKYAERHLLPDSVATTGALLIVAGVALLVITAIRCIRSDA